MKVKVYVVYDCKVEAFMAPFFMQSRGQAMRAFADSVNDRSGRYRAHPADFTLFELGEFDDSSGSLSLYEAKINLGTGLEFKEKDSVQVELEDLIREFREKAVKLSEVKSN